MMDAIMAPDTLLGRVMNAPNHLFAYDERWNTRPYRSAEIPSSNGIGSARALARTYAACIGEVDGVRLLDEQTVAAARAEQSIGPDHVLSVPTRFSAGFVELLELRLDSFYALYLLRGYFGETSLDTEEILRQQATYRALSNHPELRSLFAEIEGNVDSASRCCD